MCLCIYIIFKKYVCMYVCMCIRMYVRLFVCANLSTQPLASTLTQIQCVCVCVCFDVNKPDMVGLLVHRYVGRFGEHLKDKPLHIHVYTYNRSVDTLIYSIHLFVRSPCHASHTYIKARMHAPLPGRRRSLQCYIQCKRRKETPNCFRAWLISVFYNYLLLVCEFLCFSKIVILRCVAFTVVFGKTVF